VKEGVFSLLKGDNPFHSRPARFKGTRRETTWETGRRARISSRNESENFMGGLWAFIQGEAPGDSRHHHYPLISNK
jgi:hypothetical protein